MPSKINIGKTDRTGRVALSIIVAAIGYYYQSWWGLLAFIPLTTSYLGICPVYKMMGINSYNKNEC